MRPEHALAGPVADRLAALPPGVVAALLRVGRRVNDGFTGEITIAASQRGIRFIRWTETETGQQIAEELR